MNPASGNPKRKAYGVDSKIEQARRSRSPGPKDQSPGDGKTVPCVRPAGQGLRFLAGFSLAVGAVAWFRGPSKMITKGLFFPSWGEVPFATPTPPAASTREGSR